MSMEFGVHFVNTVYPQPGRAATFCQAAERFGFTFAVTVEHVVWPTEYTSKYPYSPTGRLPGDPSTLLPDPLVWMTHAAACTKTLRFMTGVLVLPQRNPVVLAKQLATMDYMSGGRMELGIGVGWLEEEFEGIGVPFAKRGKRSDEYIAAMRALWATDDASYDGEFANFKGMSCNPKPIQSPMPIVVGGNTQVAARRAGRLGNGYFPATGWSGDLAPLLATVRAEAEKAGRDANQIQITTGLDADDPVGSALRMAELGVSRVVVPSAQFRKDIDGGLERYAAEVIAPVQERLG
jgi:probable F420-dependent oxidoreductase